MSPSIVVHAYVFVARTHSAYVCIFVCLCLCVCVCISTTMSMSVSTCFHLYVLFTCMLPYLCGVRYTLVGASSWEEFNASLHPFGWYPPSSSSIFSTPVLAYDITSFPSSSSIFSTPVLAYDITSFPSSSSIFSSLLFLSSYSLFSRL